MTDDGGRGRVDQERRRDPEARLEAALAEVEELEARLKKEKKKRKKLKKSQKSKGTLGSKRGIETMFRTSYRTHMDLSSLADNKANIMISINGIIISILLASIAPRIGFDRWLLLPTVVLLSGSLLSLVYAVLAARPRVSRREVRPEDVGGDEANILFFGSFVSLEEDAFVEGMKTLMTNPDNLYLNMVRDLYSLGNVLDRKFRLLRTSYNLFMAGLVGGVVLFLAVFVLSTP